MKITAKTLKILVLGLILTASAGCGGYATMTVAQPAIQQKSGCIPQFRISGARMLQSIGCFSSQNKRYYR